MASSTDNSAETRDAIHALISNNEVIRQNYDKVVATLIAKGVVFRGRNNRKIHMDIAFEPNELNVCKPFPGFGIFYGTVIKYEFPFYEVSSTTICGHQV
jgi:hypothetical protein